MAIVEQRNDLRAMCEAGEAFGALAIGNTHSITGNFIQTGSGVLDFGFSGTNPGDYAHLNITGSAVLAARPAPAAAPPRR